MSIPTPPPVAPWSDWNTYDGSAVLSAIGKAAGAVGPGPDVAAAAVAAAAMAPGGSAEGAERLVGGAEEGAAA